MKKYLAEFIGTFILVFFGTGSVIVNEQSTNALGLVGISLTFGILISAVIYSIGSISGAHLNPAVTISFLLGKLIPKKDALFYISAQIIGAIFASLVLKFLFPLNTNLGATNPSGTILQSFVIELIATFVLLLTILGITQTGNKESKAFAGLIIGFLVVGLILFSGPISGGSFNPARSMAPALISGNISNLWIYLTAPIIGGVIAVYTWRLLTNEKNPSN